jgi:cytochrome P450
MSEYVDRANGLEPSVLHAELRSGRCPVHRVDDHDPPFHVLSRHTDVFDAARAPQLWRNGDGPGVFVQRGGVLGSTDDPDHRRQRSVLQDEFRPARIERLRPSIERVLDDRWAPFAQPAEGDVVELLAFPLPALVIAELLGVHADDREHFKDWSEAVVNALGGGDLAAYEHATQSIWAYIDRLVDERTALIADGLEPPDDVLTTMTHAHLAGSLSRTEVRRLGHQLLVAGHETTTSLISLMFFRLAQHPHLLAELQAQPQLIEPAIEEFLRFDSPVQGLFRTNTDDVEIGGVALPAGSKVQLLYASANRDPDVWDDPDTLRFDRDPKRLRSHLAFGWGVHHCIGASLARLEARLVLERIVAGLASLEVIDPPETTSPFILRGFQRLRMRWSPTGGAITYPSIR